MKDYDSILNKYEERLNKAKHNFEEANLAKDAEGKILSKKEMALIREILGDLYKLDISLNEAPNYTGNGSKNDGATNERKDDLFFLVDEKLDI